MIRALLPSVCARLTTLGRHGGNLRPNAINNHLKAVISVGQSRWASSSVLESGGSGGVESSQLPRAEHAVISTFGSSLFYRHIKFASERVAD